MLDSISWQEYFTTIAFLVGAYYGITSLLLYSNEIISILKRGKLTPPTSVTRDQRDSTSHDLMGHARYELREQTDAPREESVISEELHVIPAQDDEETINFFDEAEEVLKNDFIIIQDEINALIDAVSQVSKEETSSLFKTLLSNYTHFIDTPYQTQLAQFIHDSFKKKNSHEFELSEISTWWTQVQTISNNQQ